MEWWQMLILIVVSGFVIRTTAVAIINAATKKEGYKHYLDKKIKATKDDVRS